MFTSFKPGSEWLHILTGNWPSTFNVACVNIPLNKFDINQNGRYAKQEMETRYGTAFGLDMSIPSSFLLNIDFNSHTYLEKKKYLLGIKKRIS